MIHVAGWHPVCAKSMLSLGCPDSCILTIHKDARRLSLGRAAICCDLGLLHGLKIRQLCLAVGSLVLVSHRALHQVLLKTAIDHVVVFI